MESQAFGGQSFSSQHPRCCKGWERAGKVLGKQHGGTREKWRREGKQDGHRGERDVGRRSCRSRTRAEDGRGMITLTKVMWWFHQYPRIWHREGLGRRWSCGLKRGRMVGGIVSGNKGNWCSACMTKRI